MANQLSNFDPVGSFQRARSNALTIQGQEQDLALQPQRNELSQLKLSGEQQRQDIAGQAAGRATAQDAQGKQVQALRFIIQSNEAALRLPPEQRAAAFQSMLPLAQQAGIPATAADIQGQTFDDNRLNTAIRDASITLQSLQGGQQAAPTSLVRNLKAAGLQEGTPEFQEAVLSSINKPSTSINIGDKGLTEERKELAKGRVKQLTGFREDRETAIDTNQSLDVLENIDVSTGALEPAKQGLAKFGQAFGVDTSGLANVSAGEGFNAEAKRIVLAVKASQKGPQTDKDEETIRETVASLGNTKAGNQFIMDSARALNNRKIGRADFFDEFLEENETLDGANRAWSEFKRGTPMVSPVMRTPQGLPVFFFKFDQAVRDANPDATRPEILEAWRAANKKGAR